MQKLCSCIRGCHIKRHWIFPSLRLHDISINIYVYHLCFPSSWLLWLSEYLGSLFIIFIYLPFCTYYLYPFSLPRKQNWVLISIISNLLIKQTFPILVIYIMIISCDSQKIMLLCLWHRHPNTEKGDWISSLT